MAPKIMQTVVELAGSVDPSLQKSINQATKALGGIDVKGLAIGAAVAAGAVIAVKALVDVSKAAYQLGEQFDAAFDAIRIGTGATGEQLEGLKDSFKAVYSTVPTTMEDAGKAIADYNTRLGLTGKELETLSSQAIAVSGMLGEDLGTVIESSSQAFQQFGISTRDMSKEMDYAFKVSQATGIGFNELMQTVKTFGPQLQQLGFSFEESTAMMGQMEKAGIETSQIMAAMKKSITVFTKEGLSAQEGFAKYYETIKNARSETEAIGIAAEVFGARAGSSMAAAIRSGKLDIDAFTKSMQESDESIMKAMWDTADFAEKSQLLGQQFQVMVEPLASEIFDAVADLMPTISKIFEQMAPVIKKVVDMAIPLVDEVFVYVADFLEQCGPMLAQLGEAIMPLIMNILQALLPVIMELTKAVLPVLVTIVNALAPILNVLAAIIGEALVQAVNLLMPIISNLIGILTDLINFVVNVFTLHWGAAWQNIVDLFGHTFASIAALAKAPLNTVIALINTVIAGINAMKIQIPEWVPGLGGKAFAVNIPAIPMLASGGFTNGVSIAGEAGTEAVISFNSAYRDRNIDIWNQAGEMLGVSSGGSSATVTFGDIVFAPQITSTGDSNSSDILEKLKSEKTAFIDFIKSELRKETEKLYVY